jgi:hypothetical protein
MLYIDINKVDRDDAHVVMAIHICFKYMFQKFHLFHTNVAKVDYTCMFQVFSGVLYVCLPVFHLDVAYDCNGFQMFFKSFYKCFRRLFQVFHLSSFVR